MKAKKIIEVYYIGDEFYSKSGTMMSSVYFTGGIRTDWGRIRLELANGNEVHIRQATDSEMVNAYSELMQYVK